jgi:hypothetical protein
MKSYLCFPLIFAVFIVMIPAVTAGTQAPDGSDSKPAPQIRALKITVLST